MKEWERQQKLRYDEIHPEYLGLVMTDKNRWEYQKVVDKQSVERAISLSPSRKETKANSLKLKKTVQIMITVSSGSSTN